MKNIQIRSFQKAPWILLPLIFVTLSSYVTPAAEARNPVSTGVKNPLMRQCRLSGGEFWVYQSQDHRTLSIDQNTDQNLDQNTDYALCRFGSASLGALEFLVLLENKNNLQSVQLFFAKTSANLGTDSCLTQGGSLRDGVDSDGNFAQLCTFADGSMIEIDTLSRGSMDAANSALREALLKLR